MKLIFYCFLSIFLLFKPLLAYSSVSSGSSNSSVSSDLSTSVDSYKCTSNYKDKRVSRSDIEQLIQLRISEKKMNQTIDLCGASITGVDLSNLDLSYVDFREADLQKSNFINSNLSNNLFQEANLNGANLTNSFLQWSNLENATIREATLNKANISEANLSHVNLERSFIEEAIVHNTNLKGSNLRLVNLQGSNLTGSILSDVDLTGSILNNVNFTRANLSDSNLTEAQLNQADFTNANLTRAKLTSTSLIMAKFENSILENTDFSQADLNQAVYMPNPSFLPNIISIANAKNFNKITYYNFQLGAPALTVLKNAYISAGMRNMEQLITSMVKTEEMKKAWNRGGFGAIESFFSFILFYLTCNFGASPGRPLMIFLTLIFLCAIPYRIAIQKSSEHCGIFKVSKDELTGKKTTTELLRYNPPQDVLGKIIYEIKLIGIILHISILSAFQIGFQHFDISAWISRAHTQSYHFVMKGWVRSIAGVQSLLSLYLVILWALTLFGRPFSW